jgi:N-acyl-phosphatidylethanolamine-hydrolysing phospholipase D
MKDQHVNPEESVQIFQDLGCKQALAVHWGTFQLTDEPLDQPPRDLAIALQARHLSAEQFQVRPIGSTMTIAPRKGR